MLGRKGGLQIFRFPKGGGHRFFDFSLNFSIAPPTSCKCAFPKSRYQTRSSKRQAEQSGPASAENKRDRDSTSSDILCISPVHLPNSPFEDPNPFSPLLETACDSPPSSDSLSESEDMYEAPQPTVEPCDSVEEAYKSDQRQQMFNEGLCEALRVIERDKLVNPDNCPIT